jgi:hypothetical protein
MSANGHKPQGKLPTLPDDVRGLLRELGDEKLPDEREFTARLHRRLVAAGAPPSATWLGRLTDGARELWHDLRGDRLGNRTLLTGAVLGALVTAVAFTWLAAGRGDTEALRDRGPGPAAIGAGQPSLHPAEHKNHTAGDRRLTRDRSGADIGAERPERPHVPRAR